MSRSRLRPLFAAPLLMPLVLAACSLEPDYHRPVAPVSGAWSYAKAADKTATTSADHLGWRAFFVDPRLVALIDSALKNNRDLKIAALTVQQSQAALQGVQSSLLPHISGTANTTWEGLPASPNPLSVGKTTGVSHYITAGVGFTAYELDLFGQEQSQTHQALQLYLGSEQTARSVQISLVAQVAIAYVTLQSDQELLKLTADTLDSQQKSYDLVKATVANGTGTALSLAQAETQVATAKANLAQYTRQVAQDENALTLLLGEPIPADLPEVMPFLSATLMTDLPAGVPSEVLTRRPDVLAAENALKAANANIGAARAAFYPSITLTAQTGLASKQLNQLLTGPAGTWTVSPQLNIPIFNYGQNQAALDSAKIATSIQVATYEKTLQTAFHEVADALAGRATYVDQLAAQKQLVAASSDSYRLSDVRFHAGVDTYLSTLDSQRSLYAAQQNLIVLERAQLSNLITLYKALGGGWAPVTVATNGGATTAQN